MDIDVNPYSTLASFLCTFEKNFEFFFGFEAIIVPAVG